MSYKYNLTKEERLYCLYFAVCLPHFEIGVEEEDLKQEADIYKKIYLKSGKPFVDETPFLILNGIANLISDKPIKSAKKFIKDVENGIDVGDSIISDYLKLCVEDRECCFDKFFINFLSCMDEKKIDKKIEKFIFQEIEEEERKNEQK